MTQEYTGLRIVSDGSVTGTRVYSSDGEDLTGKLHVRAIRWEHRVGGAPVALLSCSLAEVEAAHCIGTYGEEALDKLASLVEVSTLDDPFRRFERRTKE